MKGRVFGLKCYGSLAEYDPATHSLRTYQCSFIEGLDELSATLPKSGMMRNGRLYPQPIWVRPISAKESGLWRTPDTCAGGTMSEEMSNYVADNKLKRPSGQHHSLRLQDQVRNPKLWPTPNTRDTRRGCNQRQLATEIAPTGKLNPMWVEWLMGFPSGWTDLED